MSQYTGHYPPMPPSSPPPPGYPGYPGYQGPPPPPPPRPQVVHLVTKPGGFWRIAMMVVALMLFAGVFIAGIFTGASFIFGMAQVDAGDAVIQSAYRKGDSSRIAVIPITGGIDNRQAEFVHAAVKNVLEDGSFRAVVLRVDSPGGGVAPSDQIWHEVQLLRQDGLPVIASFGGVAASGGYYVSCGSDYIMAEETCITGSIGVIANIMTFQGLLEKIGITPVTLVAAGSPEKSVANDIYRSWNDADKTKIKIMLDSAYTTFNKRVRDGRKAAIPDASKLDAIANGSIYTAEQAKANGLIDAIGYLDDAIAYAETATGLVPGRCTVVMIRQPPSLFGDGPFAQGRRQAATLDPQAVRGILDEFATPRVMYQMH